MPRVSPPGKNESATVATLGMSIVVDTWIVEGIDQVGRRADWRRIGAWPRFPRRQGIRICAVWFFMELRSEDGLARLAVLTGFGWLILLIAFTAAENLSRG